MKLAIAYLIIGSAAAFSLNMKSGKEKKKKEEQEEIFRFEEMDVKKTSQKPK